MTHDWRRRWRSREQPKRKTSRAGKLDGLWTFCRRWIWTWDVVFGAGSRSRRILLGKMWAVRRSRVTLAVPRGTCPLRGIKRRQPPSLTSIFLPNAALGTVDWI